MSTYSRRGTADNSTPPSLASVFRALPRAPFRALRLAFSQASSCVPSSSPGLCLASLPRRRGSAGPH
eukprot:9900075-Lingulodinium_polyedra.AAC.1